MRTPSSRRAPIKQRRPYNSVSHPVRRRRADSSSPGRLVLELALIAAAFFIGRWSIQSSATLKPEKLSGSVSAIMTSTRSGHFEQAGLSAQAEAGLCPCPVPSTKPSRIEKRRTKPKPPPPHVAPDPTAATARYLKKEAHTLSACAEGTQGAVVRLHLEIHVSPDGVVERVDITNVGPVPPKTSRCVQAEVSKMHPPGFDGSRTEIFGLTVVL